MTWILTNDDGVGAPGLLALAQAVAGEGVIVAPQEPRSGCSHQVTTTHPLQVQRRLLTKFANYQVSTYAIAGTPADCVRVALNHLYPDLKLVLSGINSGANLGVDTYISGTVAAVREAAFHRIPGIAISHYRQGKRPIDWQIAVSLSADVIAKLLTFPLEPGSFWNVNLPHLKPGDPAPEIVFCPSCTQPLPVHYRVEGEDLYYMAEYASRDRIPGTDVDVCFSGHIAVTQIHL